MADFQESHFSDTEIGSLSPDELEKARPSPEIVNEFHTNSDLDVGELSQHHTLGYGHTQAAHGDHTHSTKEILDDTDWVTDDLGVSSGWSKNYAEIRMISGIVNLVVSVTRTGGTITATSNGNYSDTNVLSIPSKYQPSHVIPISGQRSGYFPVSSKISQGNLRLVGGYTDVKNGYTMIFNGMWMVDSDT